MSGFSRTERIRDIIRSKFQQSGASSAQQVTQTLLIQEGRFCGYRFRQGRHQAVWFVEEDQIKFYGAEGHLLEVIAPSELIAAADQQSRAA